MNHRDAYDWAWLSIMYAMLGVWAFVQIRYLIRRHGRNRWPTAEAIIQKGALGNVPIEKGATVHAGFLGYVFTVQGARYAGYFALIGDETRVQSTYDALAGSTIQVRYNPSEPDVSFLADYKDRRFEGLKVTQSPQILNRAPSFDLQDAIRGAGTRR
jgi:hypothetical protein